MMECKKSNVTFEADAALKLEKEACMEGELLYNLCNSCSSVADLVHFFRSGWPKKTGSASRSYLDVFLMLSKINNFSWHFLTKCKHLLTLKIRDKKLF